MRPFTRFVTACRVPFPDKLLFLEAVATSAYVRFSLSFLPFKKVARWLGGSNVDLSGKDSGSARNGNDSHSVEIVQKIKLAVSRCNRYTPWKTECYTQALTGKILLQRRHIMSIIYIGFMKDGQAKYRGHAWLKVNGLFVTGYNKQLQQFQVHSFFS